MSEGVNVLWKLVSREFKHKLEICFDLDNPLDKKMYLEFINEELKNYDLVDVHVYRDSWSVERIMLYKNILDPVYYLVRENGRSVEVFKIGEVVKVDGDG